MLRKDLAEGQEVTDIAIETRSRALCCATTSPARDTMFGTTFMQWYRGKRAIGRSVQRVSCTLAARAMGSPETLCSIRD